MAGTDSQPPSSRPGGPTIAHRSGWAATFDDGQIRWISHDGREVLRGLGPTVRDADWRAVQPTTSVTAVDPSEVACRCAYRSLDLAVDVDLRYALDDRGVQLTSVLHVVGDTIAHRLGLSLLFPLSVIGQPLHVVGEGHRGVEAFPAEISSELLGTRLEGLSWGLGGECHATLVVTGQRWDVEDQRNWSDASFKGFTPPLEGSEPRHFTAGESIAVEVRLEVSGPRPTTAASTGRTPRRGASTPSSTVLEVGDLPLGALPSIGCVLEAEPGPELAALAALAPGHLRLPLDLRVGSWPERLDRAVAMAREIDTDLVIELLADDADPLEEFAAAAAGTARRDVVREVLVFDTGDGLGGVTSSADRCTTVRGALRRLGSAIPVGGGSRANYRELESGPDLLASLETVTFGLSPLVHVSDDSTIVENLATLPVLAATAIRRFAPRPVDLACSLRPRLDPYCRRPTGMARPDRYDDRLHSSLGASWLVGLLAGLAGSGLRRLTLFEATGPAGWVTGDGPRQGGSSILTAALAALPRTGLVLPVRGDLGMAAVAVRQGTRTTVLAANLTSEAAALQLRVNRGAVQRVRALRGTEAGSPSSPVADFSGDRVDAVLQPREILVVVAANDATTAE